MGLAISKKLLFITNDFGPRAGGIETFIIGLIERRPFGSTIVYTSTQAESFKYDEKWLTDYGVRVIRDPAKILLPTPRVARRIATIVKSEQIKVAAFGAAAPLGLLSASIKRAGVVRSVALTHGHEVWWAKVFPFNLIMRRIGATVDVLTYLGEFTRGEISKALTPAARKAMVKIAPGIDTQHFAPQEAELLRASLGLSGKKIIVSVGRLVHRKGQDHLIAALPQILKSVPDAHLVLVGQGPYQAHLLKLVQQLKLQDQVTFIGRIQYQALPQYICLGDVFAMPARSRFLGLEVEGLGIVYLEASACGLPVVAGASGGAPDAVVVGKSGVVVNGVDNAQIAESAVALLSDPEKSKEMGAFGRQWIIDNWSWHIWSSEFEKLLNQ